MSRSFKPLGTESRELIILVTALVDHYYVTSFWECILSPCVAGSIHQKAVSYSKICAYYLSWLCVRFWFVYAVKFHNSFIELLWSTDNGQCFHHLSLTSKPPFFVSSQCSIELSNDYFKILLLASRAQ